MFCLIWVFCCWIWKLLCNLVDDGFFGGIRLMYCLLMVEMLCMVVVMFDGMVVLLFSCMCVVMLLGFSFIDFICLIVILW